MIVEFNVLLVAPSFYLVTAIMLDEPPIQIGIFEEVEEVDEACKKFKAEHDKRLN